MKLPPASSSSSSSSSSPSSPSSYSSPSSSSSSCSTSPLLLCSSSTSSFVVRILLSFVVDFLKISHLPAVLSSSLQSHVWYSGPHISSGFVGWTDLQTRPKSFTFFISTSLKWLRTTSYVKSTASSFVVLPVTRILIDEMLSRILFFRNTSGYIFKLRFKPDSSSAIKELWNSWGFRKSDMLF